MPGINKTVSAENPATLPLTGSELVRVVQTGNSAKTTTQDIANLAPFPLTTKGDLFTYSGTANARFPVGIDGYVLSSNSGATSGLQWIAAGVSATVLADPSNGHGADLIGGVGRVVNSIATLKLLSKTGVGKAVVLGYYVAGDGGGGQYYFDPADTTSADNGGTIIVATDGGRWKLSYMLFLSLRQFGAKGDGTTDDTTTVQNCITAAPPNAILYVPPGNYKITTTLNVANRGKAGLVFQGAGSGIYGLYNTMPNSGSNFYGLTGTQAIFETQGSHRICFRDLGMYSLLADANRSTVGIVLGRTTVIPSCEFHHYENVDISLANNASANATRGSIGLYNLQGEHGTFDNLRIISDTPLVQFDNNPYSYTATYGTLQVTASSTLNQYKECAFSSLSKYCMELRGIQSTSFIDCYYGTFTGGTNLQVAVNIAVGNNKPADIFFTGGQIETWNSFIEIGDDCHNIDIDTTWANATGTGPLILLDVANNQKAYGLRARFWNPQNLALQIVSVGVAAGVTMYGGCLVLNQGLSVNQSTLTMLGTDIVDLNATPTTVTASGSSVFCVRNATNALSSYGAQMYSSAGFKTGSAAAMMASSVAMNNGAAAAAGTLTNAPTAGNPTKWIPFNDNGTIRYIPAW